MLRRYVGVKAEFAPGFLVRLKTSSEAGHMWPAQVCASKAPYPESHACAGSSSRGTRQGSGASQLFSSGTPI